MSTISATEAPHLQQIDLTKLSLQQLGQLKQQLDQELTVFQDSLQTLKVAQNKYQESNLCLDKVTPTAKGKSPFYDYSSLFIAGPIFHFYEWNSTYFVQIKRKRRPVAGLTPKVHAWLGPKILNSDRNVYLILVFSYQHWFPKFSNYDRKHQKISPLLSRITIFRISFSPHKFSNWSASWQSFLREYLITLSRRLFFLFDE